MCLDRRPATSWSTPIAAAVPLVASGTLAPPYDKIAFGDERSSTSILTRRGAKSRKGAIVCAARSLAPPRRRRCPPRLTWQRLDSRPAARHPRGGSDQRALDRRGAREPPRKRWQPAKAAAKTLRGSCIARSTSTRSPSSARRTFLRLTPVHDSHADGARARAHDLGAVPGPRLRGRVRATRVAAGSRSSRRSPEMVDRVRAAWSKLLDVDPLGFRAACTSASTIPPGVDARGSARSSIRSCWPAGAARRPQLADLAEYAMSFVKP